MPGDLKDYGEYLADVSSFANTTGGDIIIGMTAEEGVPTGFAPLQIDRDAEILRLDNIARSGLQPRIFGLDIRGYQIATAASLSWFAFPEATISRTASFAREQDITAFMRGRRLGSTSRTLMSFDCCSRAPHSLPIASVTFDLTGLPKLLPTTRLSRC